MPVRARIGGVWPALVAGLACSGCATGGEGGDPCSGVGCSSRGFCVADQGQTYCACIAGYHPVLRACEPNDSANPCLGIDCSGHGTCRVDADGPTCDCADGYRTLAGSACTDRECDLVCVPAVATDGGPCVPEGAERCDGRDNDCDGLTDEDFDLDFERANCGGCGVACTDASHGRGTCVLGDCEMLCEPGWANVDGNPSNGCEAVCEPDPGHPESACNGRDDDCDGTTDEDWSTVDTCGEGLCRRSSICHDGTILCRPRTPPAATDGTCDGVDDDCDGRTDEDCGADADADADGDADAEADGDADAEAEADAEADGPVCGNGVLEGTEECDGPPETCGECGGGTRTCDPATCTWQGCAGDPGPACTRVCPPGECLNRFLSQTDPGCGCEDYYHCIANCGNEGRGTGYDPWDTPCGTSDLCWMEILPTDYEECSCP